VYSDFYEIPLPALRFEKVEETDTKWNDTEENDAFQIDHGKSKENDAQIKKSKFTRKRRHAKKTQNASKTTSNDTNRFRTEASFVREIKLTHSKMAATNIFFEIPLLTLHFEKTEGIETNNHKQEEMTLKYKNHMRHLHHR
jgi:hypothetical protein